LGSIIDGFIAVSIHPRAEQFIIIEVVKHPPPPHFQVIVRLLDRRNARKLQGLACVCASQLVNRDSGKLHGADKLGAAIPASDFHDPRIVVGRATFRVVIDKQELDGRLGGICLLQHSASDFHDDGRATLRAASIRRCYEELADSRFAIFFHDAWRRKGSFQEPVHGRRQAIGMGQLGIVLDVYRQSGLCHDSFLCALVVSVTRQNGSNYGDSRDCQAFGVLETDVQRRVQPGVRQGATGNV
jgi:hypothetical protein